MSDQPQVEAQAPAAIGASARSERGEVQLISRDEFNAPPSSQARKTNKWLRTRNKRLGKAVQKHKDTIQDLKYNLHIADEDLTNACMALRNTQQDLEICKRELDNAQKQVAASAQSSDGEDVQTIRKQLADSQWELKASQKKVHRLLNSDKSLGETQMKLAALQSELSACKDDLFRLQPAAQVPDSDISKGFESLNQQIVNCIDAEVLAFEKVYPEAEPEDLFLHGSHNEAASFLQLHPAAGEDLARFLIHRFLRHHVFGESVYLLGLPEEMQRLLRSAEHTMAKMGPSSGK